MRILAVLFAIAVPCAALAQDETLLPEDDLLTRAEVVALTSGATLEFYDDGASRYSVGGAYSYTYASGQTAFGRFDVNGDGAVCVTFRNGRARCDRFVRSHGRVVLLTESGGRYPIRP